MDKINNQAPKSYSDAVKMSKCEDQWYKKFGSFLIGIVNGRKDFLHSCGVVGLSMVLIASVPSVEADPAVNALPTGYQSVAGNVQFNENANTLNVSSQANSSIANYQTFNVGQNATVNFNLPNSQSAILNRVTGGIGSEIFGSINSNGKVFLVNPSGVLFGSTSQVNVGSLVTSTLNTSNEKFLKGNYSFEQQGNTPASIVNQGKITAKDGSVVLLGGAVQSTGSIQAAPNGSIQMAVGKSATILTNDGINVDVQINEALQEKVEGIQSAISNTGSLSANSIKAQAELNGAIYDQAINNAGLIQANSFTNKNGTIELVSKTGIVENTGSLIANNSNGKGGNIKVIGTETYLLNNSLVEANGKTGGGTVLIGGDYQGHGEHNSKITFLDKNSSIKANAIESGNGGKAIIWADETAIINGEISAKGGSVSGNGGFIETSGKENLLVNKDFKVNTSALNGKTGNWLLDPTNITIQAGGPDTPTLAQLRNPLNFASYTIDPSLLTGAGSDIALVALNNITNNSTLNFASGIDFTALAGNNFTSATGTGISTLNAGITIGAGRNVQLNNANLTATNGDVVLAAGNGAPPFFIPNTGSISGTGILRGTSLLAATRGGGNVTLTNAANDFTNLTAFLDNAGTFSYRDANAINLQNYTVPPAIAAQIAPFGLPSTYINDLGLGNLTLTAGGNITQSAGANLTGVQALNVTTTGAGNITLNEATNNTNTLRLRTDGGSATYRDTNGFAINGIQLNNGAGANGDLTLTAGGAGNIAQTADITQVNNFNLATGTGSATLTRPGNNVASFNANTAAGNANTIAFTDANGFTLGNSNVGNGTLALRSASGGAGAGNIAQIAGTSVRGNNLSLQTGSGTANIGEALNNFNNLTSNSTSGNITYRDANTINLQSSNVGTGTLNVSTVLGDINQSGIIRGGNLLVNANQGNVNLFVVGLANDFNNLGLSASNNASYLDSDGININSVSGAGNSLSITAGNAPNPNGQDTATGITINSNITAAFISLNAEAGNISQNAGTTIQGTSLNLATAGGNATIDDADFTNLSANTNNGTAIYSDRDGINIGSSNVGTGTLTVNSSVTGLVSNNTNAETNLTINNFNITGQNINLNANGTDNINQLSGTTIQGTNLNLATAGGNATINDVDFTNLTANTNNGSVTYSDKDGINIGSSNVGTGTLTVNSSVTGLVSDNANNAETNLNLSGNITGQTINLSASGADNINQTAGTVQGTNLNLATTGNSINIIDADSYQVSFNAPNANTINYTERDGYTITGSSNLGASTATFGINPALLSNNNDPVAPETTIIASNLSGGDLILNGNANFTNVDFATVAANGANINVSISDTDGLQVLDSDLGNSGSLNVITQTTGANTNGNPFGSEDDLDLNGNINAQTITLNALSNDINQVAGIMTGQDLSANTNTGNITLLGDPLAGQFNDLVNFQTNSNSGTVAYVDDNDINLLTSNVGAGNLYIRSEFGNINQSGAISGNSLVAQTASNGDINLTNTNNLFNDFTGVSSDLLGNGGNINYTNNGNINLTTATSPIFGGTLPFDSGTGTINITTNTGSNGNINILSDITGQTINLDADGTGIIQQALGTSITGNTLTTTTDTGDVLLGIPTNDVNDFQATSTSGSVGYADANDINLLASNVGTGNLIIGSFGPGNITQSGALTGNNLVLGATQGNIILNTNPNDFNILNMQAAQDASYTDADGINLVGNNFAGNGSTTTNIFSVTAGNSPNPNGQDDIVGININSPTATDISFGGLDINGGMQVFTGASPVIVTAGTVDLTAQAGNINQSGGTVQGTNLNLSTQGGDATITNADFSNLTANTNDGNATYSDLDGINVNDSNVGAGILTVNSLVAGLVSDNLNAETDLNLIGDITGQTVNLNANGTDNITQPSGTVQGTNLNLATQGRNADINDADFTNLTANTNNGNATYSDADGINVDDSNVGTGTLTVNSSVTGLASDNNNAETNITLNGNITGQTVSLNADGTDNISQVSGNFTGGNLNLNTQGGTANLGINGNTDFAIIGGNTNGGNANYIDTDGLTVSDFKVGNGTLNIISSKGNNSVNLNGDPFGSENDIVLNGLINGANVNLIAQTNDAIVQTGGVVNANNLLLQTNTGNASLPSLNNNIGNLTATSNSGVFTINELNGLNILPSNLGNGSLAVNSGGTINVAGSLNAPSGIALTAGNEANINLGNNVLSVLNGSIQLIANTGSINGLNRNNYPRLIAPDIILIGNKVGDINAPIGLWEGMQSGYIIDRANQTGFSPRPNYLFEYNFIKNLLLSENGFSLYPVLIPPLNNGFLFSIKTNTKTPVIANVLAGQAKQGSAGNFYTTTSGSYILYNNESNNNQPKISTDNMISGLENYIKASGKVVLDNASVQGDEFIKTAGQFVSPVNSDNIEYTVSAGAFLPVDYSDIAFPSDKNREVKNIDQ